MRGPLAALAIAAAVANPVAQTPAPPAKPATQTTPAASAPRPTVATPRAAAAKATSVRVSVKDQNGAALADVRLLVSGAATGEFTTGAAGTAIVPIPKAGL